MFTQASDASVGTGEEVCCGLLAALFERAWSQRGHAELAQDLLPHACAHAVQHAVTGEAAEGSVHAEGGARSLGDRAAIIDATAHGGLECPATRTVGRAPALNLGGAGKACRKRAAIGGRAGWERGAVEDLPVACGHAFIAHASARVAALASVAAEACGHFEFGAACSCIAEVGAKDDWVHNASSEANAKREHDPSRSGVRPLEPFKPCRKTGVHFELPVASLGANRHVKRMPCSCAVRGSRRPWQLIVGSIWCLAGAPLVQAQDAEPISQPAVEPFDVPEACPSRASLEAEIAVNLGHTPPANIGRLSVRPRAAGFTATLTFEAGDSRTLEGETCAGLMHAVALIVAVQIDPEAMFRAPSPPVEPPRERRFAELEGTCEPGREVRIDEDCALGEPFGPAGRTRREPGGRFLFGTALSVELGAMPGLSAGAWIGGTARIGIVEVGAEARYQPEAFSPLPQRPAIGAVVSLLAGRARVGLAISLGEIGPLALELVPHVALELGAVSARGAGLLTPIGTSSFWIALAPGAELRAFVFEHLGLFVRAEVEIALRRSPFVIAGYSTPAFLASPVGLTSLVGILLRTN